MVEQQASEVQEVTTYSTPSAKQVVKTTKMSPPVDTQSPHQTYQTKKAIFRTYQIIWYLLGVVEILLAFRVLLKLLGANPFSGFVSFIYAISAPFALPFAGILETSAADDIVMEWSTLIAMAVYAIIAYGIVALFQLVKPTTPQEVDQTIDSQ